MTIALGMLALVVLHPSRTSTRVGLTVFGLGFGMVGQVLIVAVQNSVDRRRLGIAMATTTFFRGLGGAIGAAVLDGRAGDRAVPQRGAAAARGSARLGQRGTAEHRPGSASGSGITARAAQGRRTPCSAARGPHNRHDASK